MRKPQTLILRSLNRWAIPHGLVFFKSKQAKSCFFLKVEGDNVICWKGSQINIDSIFSENEKSIKVIKDFL